MQLSESLNLGLSFLSALSGVAAVWLAYKIHKQDKTFSILNQLLGKTNELTEIQNNHTAEILRQAALSRKIHHNVFRRTVKELQSIVALGLSSSYTFLPAMIDCVKMVGSKMKDQIDNPHLLTNAGCAARWSMLVSRAKHVETELWRVPEEDSRPRLFHGTYYDRLTFYEYQQAVFQQYLKGVDHLLAQCKINLIQKEHAKFDGGTISFF